LLFMSFVLAGLKLLFFAYLQGHQSVEIQAAASL